jgi:NAD(P)-dependent dehydrogenase (short-subunit alcohol dehydrogenase family)
VLAFEYSGKRCWRRAGHDADPHFGRPADAPYAARMTLYAWTEPDVPDQTGRTFLVTGANSGTGYETARVLAERGAAVILTGRRPEALDDAAERITQCSPHAKLATEHLELADLDSIESAATRVAERYEALDGLVNNAGVMALSYGTTVDGFEQQFGINHLGHFALTGRLLPLLTATPNSRVVTVASDMHRMGRLEWDPSGRSRRYRRWQAYADSKLANLLFAYELQRRAAAAGLGIISAAAHPGYAATNLQTGAARLAGRRGRFWKFAHAFAQSAADGALPILRAATDPAAGGGSYFGPAGGRKGPATLVESNGRSHDTDSAGRLWELSEELTGVAFGI